MPREGVEPSRVLSPVDFESTASADSATPAGAESVPLESDVRSSSASSGRIETPMVSVVPNSGEAEIGIARMTCCKKAARDVGSLL